MSFQTGIWVLAIICFSALREYFSLIDIRLQDRVAILGAYLSIPFMIYFIQISWYGMFIISIPVYVFLAIPLLVTLGGNETQGTVFSIGAIEFGLFAFVFCLGHLGYLASFSTWMAALIVINVLACDSVSHVVGPQTKTLWGNYLVRFLAPLPITVTVSIVLSEWTEIPLLHSIILAGMIPILSILGHRAGDFVGADLRIEEDLLIAGRGQILNNLKSLLLVAPVTFHYLRYFLEL
jgi:phosphatidate cytidylyltransferase